MMTTKPWETTTTKSRNLTFRTFAHLTLQTSVYLTLQTLVYLQGSSQKQRGGCFSAGRFPGLRAGVGSAHGAAQTREPAAPRWVRHSFVLAGRFPGLRTFMGSAHEGTQTRNAPRTRPHVKSYGTPTNSPTLEIFCGRWELRGLRTARAGGSHFFRTSRFPRFTVRRGLVPRTRRESGAP